MDKEPTLTAIWSFSLAGAIVGFLLCRWRAWFILVVLPLALIFPFAVILELSDPSVGPAILHEAGKTYQIQVYFVIVIIVIANATGVIVRLATHKRKLPKGT